ncbi:MAG: redox-sensing transcriptional repressor Rex [Planctomycetota bacterium]|nr:MAG: redox-sensing transcriptional repressor Rex [Planctomycetota bacterium]
MSKSPNIPMPAVRRLSLYLRQLERFAAGNRRTVSSRQLGEALGLSDAQVRKDLGYFGQFGQPGVGYRVPELIQRVRRILGTHERSNVLLVGVGNLGRALLSFRGFIGRGFRIVAAFDNDPDKIGQEVGTAHRVRVQPVEEMAETARARSIRLGVLTVPAEAAPQVARAMVSAGVRAILNFAPVTLNLGPEVAVSSVDLTIHLEQLGFHLRDGWGGDGSLPIAP